MRASEWQFLCAVHEQPKSCCAIDYCCHTLDWAANVVTDQKIFPSRFVVMSDTHSKNVGIKNLVNVFRRLHRIFAHAWFQHRGVFWSVEGQSGLYVFFKSVCDLYDLLPAENYKLPPEAEGLEQPSIEQEVEKPAPQILKPPSQQRAPPPEEDNLHPTRTNTRRHIRSSPSTGSAVTTVMEAEEEEADGVARKMREMHIAPPTPIEEDADVAEVPVIVEQPAMAEPTPQKPETSAQEKEDEEIEDEEESEEESDADQTIVDIDSGQNPEKEEEDVSNEKSEPTDDSAAVSNGANETSESKDQSKDQKPSEPAPEEALESKEKEATDSKSSETESKKTNEETPTSSSSSSSESSEKDAAKGKDE